MTRTLTLGVCASAASLALVLFAAQPKVARAEDDTKCYYLNKYVDFEGGVVCANVGKVCVQCRKKV